MGLFLSQIIKNAIDLSYLIDEIECFLNEIP